MDPMIKQLLRMMATIHENTKDLPELIQELSDDIEQYRTETSACLQSGSLLKHVRCDEIDALFGHSS